MSRPGRPIRLDSYCSLAGVKKRNVSPHRQKKKKVVEELSDDSDHGDFDAQQVRDHEEWTKVIEGLSVVILQGGASYIPFVSSANRLRGSMWEEPFGSH